ncbi:unnamed protein product [Lactuca saligna]|uniref:Uncharacterized protein n=1 Tax=Lactuca saligna TaxID=75948 RepID=A0AA36A0I6_LACSI|nr:unnamed protein product [Lactuca saligna]
MQTVLKRQFRTTQCLIFRPLSTLINPKSFLDINFSSLGNVAALDDHKENHLKSIDLDLLAQLQHGSHGSICSSYALNNLISSCATSRSLYIGIQIHSFVIKMGFSPHVYISTALLDMYGKCGVISDAQKLFDETPHRNVITWNSLISAVLVGCSQLETLELGEQVHGLSTKFGFLSNVVVCTSLLEMYWKCSNVDDSRRIFDEISDKNAVVWTSMITGYTQNQQTNIAMCMIKKMLVSGHKADSITYNTLLSSFSNTDDMIHCEQIHGSIIKQGLDSDVYLAVTLVTVYSKCGSSLQDFHKICATLPLRNKITCNAIIAGFSNMGNVEKALGVFSEMRQIVKSGHSSNIYIQNGLISMYAKSGNFDEAKLMFTSMVEHDTVSWNSLLSCYAQHGKGLVKKGLEYFELMRSNYGSPKVEHYACVVDLYSRAGFLDEAEVFVNKLGMEVGPEVYKALLSACRVHGNKEIGLRMSRKIVDLFPDDPAVYVQVSNVLASNGYWDDSARAHNLICSKGIKKKAACSWI